ncbi:hypothetical protein DXN05_15045 [Deminuibacter soli]|uniref:Uncharacterized protein n=1 Tax=Deminuibacter soli TaxID=2291815 RepID=A0A3E1NHB6_9BACT|nr:hypothetical protein DXN05_15045 [Deminuibacter soli]
MFEFFCITPVFYDLIINNTMVLVTSLLKSAYLFRFSTAGIFTYKYSNMQRRTLMRNLLLAGFGYALPLNRLLAFSPV